MQLCMKYKRPFVLQDDVGDVTVKQLSHLLWDMPRYCFPIESAFILIFRFFICDKIEISSDLSTLPSRKRAVEISFKEKNFWFQLVYELNIFRILLRCCSFIANFSWSNTRFFNNS